MIHSSIPFPRIGGGTKVNRDYKLSFVVPFSLVVEKSPKTIHKVKAEKPLIAKVVVREHLKTQGVKNEN